VKYYYAVVHKDADSAFGVTFPDLPGCFSAADDLADVLSNAVEAVELYLEDAPSAPAPRGMEAIRQEAAQDLAQGSFLIAVPFIRNTGK
jgi:predicted RNase H-like HicB family nuclease